MIIIVLYTMSSGRERWTTDKYHQLEQLMMAGKQKEDLAKELGVTLAAVHLAQKRFLKVKMHKNKMSAEDLVIRYHVTPDLINEVKQELATDAETKHAAHMSAATVLIPAAPTPLPMIYMEISKNDLGTRTIGNISISITDDKIIIK